VKEFHPGDVIDVTVDHKVEYSVFALLIQRDSSNDVHCEQKKSSMWQAFVNGRVQVIQVFSYDTVVNENE